MNELIKTPVFGILLSLMTFQIGIVLNKKTKSYLVNPLLISQLLIIFILTAFDISYDDYNIGGKLITFFLIPSTIVLAVPLYRKIYLLKQNAIPIIGGVIVGSLSGIISVIVLAKAFQLEDVLLYSLVPKSITSPIGMEVAKQIGGIPAITVPVIILTGILGSIMAPFIFKLFHITDEVAVGVSLGTSSHAVGTAKALEMGDVEGAMSSLAISIAGIVTVFAVPLILKLFGIIGII